MAWGHQIREFLSEFRYKSHSTFCGNLVELRGALGLSRKSGRKMDFPTGTQNLVTHMNLTT